MDCTHVAWSLFNGWPVERARGATAAAVAAAAALLILHLTVFISIVSTSQDN